VKQLRNSCSQVCANIDKSSNGHLTPRPNLPETLVPRAGCHRFQNLLPQDDRWIAKFFRDWNLKLGTGLRQRIFLPGNGSGFAVVQALHQSVVPLTAWQRDIYQLIDGFSQGLNNVFSIIELLLQLTFQLNQRLEFGRQRAFFDIRTFQITLDALNVLTAGFQTGLTMTRNKET
jgi:hypothetical protein